METWIAQYRAAIDRQPLNRRQIGLLLVCTALLVTDGFDAQSIAFVAPVLMKHWGSGKAAFGQVFSAGLIGLTVGALFFSVLADRYGHRRVLQGCAVWYGFATLATAFAPTIDALLALRFVTGFGLGGAMPIVIGIVSESTPNRLRSRFITLSVCGFSLGGVVGGFAAAPLIEAFGWSSVFVAGGVVPLLLVPIVGALLPESLPYLIRARRDRATVERELRRVAPGLTLTEAAASLDCAADSAPAGAAASKRAKRFLLAELFAPGYARATLLIWCTCFMNLVAMYFLLNWLPTVIHDAGLTLREASITTGLFSTGGTIGAITVSWRTDRSNPRYVLALSFLAATACVAAVGMTRRPHLVMLATACAGFFVIGGQIAFNAFVGRFYPTRVRATGIGWALGVGRLGGIAGPLLGAALLSLRLPTQQLFLCAAVPPVIAALAIVMVRAKRDDAQDVRADHTTAHAVSDELA
jgi:AAHS family 4-hydroxybenzoate transporter-like MFS transporter